MILQKDKKFREDIQAKFIILLEDIDISKEKSLPRILKQENPSLKKIFQRHIKEFREGRGIDYTEFRSKAEKARILFENYEESGDQRKTKKYLKPSNELKEYIKSKITNDDLLRIRNDFDYPQYWDFSVKKYIFTNIMPRPTKYLGRFKVDDSYVKGSKENWRLNIIIYGYTTRNDILSSWKLRVENLLKYFPDYNKKSAHRADELVPKIYPEYECICLPICGDTSREDVKYIWPKISALQKKLPTSWIKYSKEKKYVDRIKKIRRVGYRGNYEDAIPLEYFGDEFQRKRKALTKAKHLLTKEGFIEPFKIKPTKRK